MKILLLVTAVVALSAASPALQQTELEKETEMEQYYDDTVEEMSLSNAEVQELKDILEDLLSKTDAVSAQAMSVEMQGFWSKLRRGLGSAFKIARKGVGLFSRHVVPLLSQQPQQQPWQQPQQQPWQQPQQQPWQQPQQQPPKRAPIQFRARPIRRGGRKVSRRRPARRRYNRKGRGRRSAEQEEDYTMEQLLASLQQYGDYGTFQQYGDGTSQQYDDYGTSQQDDVYGDMQQYDDQKVAKAQFLHLLGLFRKMQVKNKM